MIPEETGDAGRGPWVWVCLVGVVLLAATVRFVGLAERPLWLDEALSVLYTQVDLSTLFELRREGTNPPLYHMILSKWVAVFGTSEAGLRSLSVLAGTAAVAMLYVLGRSIGGATVGLAAASLLALNSMAVGFSQEARYYAIVELLAIAASLMLRCGMRCGRGQWFVGYAVVMGIFVWTHLFAWFVLAAHIAAIAWVIRRYDPRLPDRRRLAIHFGLAVAMVAVCFVPWVGITVSQVRTALGNYWIPCPGPSLFLASVHSFVVPLEALRWPFVGSAIAGAGYLWFSQKRTDASHRHHPPEARFDRAMLWMWATIPVCIPFGWSLVGQPIYQVKYAIACQPAVLILLSLAFVRRSVVALLFVALAAAVHAPTPHRGLQVEDWRQAAAIIDKNGNAGDTVYVSQDYTYYALVYYLGEDRHTVIPVTSRGGAPGEFRDLYPHGPLTYEQWLNWIKRDDEAWVVLSRVRGSGPRGAFAEFLQDLSALGTVKAYRIDGDVDVLFWKRSSIAPTHAIQ